MALGMRTSIYILMFLILAGCAAGRQSDEQTANSGSEASACIEREAIRVAPTKVDLETAATAVISICSVYTEATRRDLIARYPGYRDYMAPKLRELDNAYMDHARRAVAVARTLH